MYCVRARSTTRPRCSAPADRRGILVVAAHRKHLAQHVIHDRPTLGASACSASVWRRPGRRRRPWRCLHRDRRAELPRDGTTYLRDDGICASGSSQAATRFAEEHAAPRQRPCRTHDVPRSARPGRQRLRGASGAARELTRAGGSERHWTWAYLAFHRLVRVLAERNGRGVIALVARSVDTSLPRRSLQRGAARLGLLDDREGLPHAPGLRLRTVSTRTIETKSRHGRAGGARTSRSEPSCKETQPHRESGLLPNSTADFLGVPTRAVSTALGADALGGNSCMHEATT